MKPEIKTKWLTALRSDEYRQGTGYLRQQHEGSKPQFCCLGVLCDIAVKDGLDLEVGEWSPEITEYDGIYDVLPESVKEWAGLSSTNPTVEIEDEDDPEDTRHETVADLNDSGDTFAEIADLIEKQF